MMTVDNHRDCNRPKAGAMKNAPMDMKQTVLYVFFVGVCGPYAGGVRKKGGRLWRVQTLGRN